MEIFEKIGDAASKTYKYTAEKTSKIAKETKLKIKINEYKREIEDIYREIGETIYEKSVTDQELNKEEILGKCEAIDNITEKIVECKDELLNLKERKQCKNCYQEIEMASNYCPNCGCEQERAGNTDEEQNDSNVEEESKKEENEDE